MAIQLVALDFDGVMNVDGQIPAALRRALAFLRGRGVVLTTASGRPYAEQREFARADGLFEFLTCNECEIYRWNGSGYRPCAVWNERVRLRWRDVLEEARALARDVIVECQDRRVNARWEPEMDIPRGMISLWYSNEDDAAEWVRRLRTRVDPGRLKVNRNGGLVQISSDLWGKGLVVLEVASRLAIAPESVLCIGDSENDREMVAGPYGFRGAVPANATPALRLDVAKAGGLVAYHAVAEGTLEILERVFPELLTLG